MTGYFVMLEESFHQDDERSGIYVLITQLQNKTENRGDAGEQAAATWAPRGMGVLTFQKM